MRIDISIDDAKKMVKENSTKFVDVRSKEEYEGGHIDDAINIDIMSESFLDEVEKLNKGGHYVVYCESGSRSLSAVSTMEMVGFKNVFNMVGGITEWNHKKGE